MQRKLREAAAQQEAELEEHQRRDAEVVHGLQLAADRGDAVGQFNLGWMYEHGTGVPQDAVQAVRLYRLAAEQGHATAQFSLGWMCAKGVGVPKDDAEAARLFQQLTAEQRHAAGMHWMESHRASVLGLV